MSPLSPRCSVVVRCYNEREHIGRLLEALGRQTVKTVEIIVVDSGSTDGTLDEVSRFPVQLLSISPAVFSFGRSLNRGCEQAQADWIVIASAHVYPTSADWLERLLAPFSDPLVALVYGKQRGHATSNFSETQVFSSWYPDHSEPAQDFPFANNANSAIRRSVWKRLPYDESLTGLEDIAWAKAIMALGYRIAYEASAEVVHIHNETPARIFHRYRREAIALKRIFPEERFTIWDFFRLCSVNILSDLIAARRQGTLLRHSTGIFTYRSMQFWGAFRGFARPAALTHKLRRTLYYPKGLVREYSGQQRQLVGPPVQIGGSELPDTTPSAEEGVSPRAIAGQAPRESR